MRKQKWSKEEQLKARARAGELHAGRTHASPAHALLAELRFVRTWIAPDQLADEVALTETCWIEYAYLSALRRTELFTQKYEELFRRFHVKYVDYLSVNDITPIQAEFALNTESEMTALWRARQHADAIGVPYETFIGQAMESMLIAEGHKKIPRPNQLYSDKPVDHVLRYWSQWRETRVPSMFDDSWDGRFFADQFRGDPVQLRAMAIIEEHVMSVPPERRGTRVANFVIHRPVMPEAEARQRFGDSAVDEALASAGPTPPRRSSVDSALYRPGCLGLVFRDESINCAGCRIAGLCTEFVRRLDREFKEICGDTSPKTARKRSKAAERKRNQRSRERAASAGVGKGGELVPELWHD